MEKYLTRDTDRADQAPLSCIGTLKQEGFSRQSFVH